MIEVYRGSINTWECDEMGHLNVRHYVGRMMEGLAGFAHAAEMPHAFRATSPSTLQPRDQVIRFMREALPARPLTMTAGVLEVEETSVLVYQQLDHGDGQPCASFTTWIDHIDTQTRRPFQWSRRTLEAFDTLKTSLPEKMGPRSTDLSTPPRSRATLADADAVGAPVIGRGVAQPHECDLFGWFKPDAFMGRMSDAIPNLLAAWREDVAQAARDRGETVRTGAAVLEYRLVYRRWPKAGDRFLVRSALNHVGEKTHALAHWILDPDSGEAWCTAQAVAVTLDLDARKIVPTSKDQMDALRKRIPDGLSV